MDSGTVASLPPDGLCSILREGRREQPLGPSGVRRCGPRCLPAGTHKLGVPGKAVAQGLGVVRVTGCPRYAKGFGVPEPWRTWRSPLTEAPNTHPRGQKGAKLAGCAAGLSGIDHVTTWSRATGNRPRTVPSKGPDFPWQLSAVSTS